MNNDYAVENQAEKPKQQVKHPSHYNVYDREVVDMMCDIWGPEATAIWCKLTAFKYRMRAGFKDDVNTDLAKESWCLDMMKKYQELSIKNSQPVSATPKTLLCD